MARDSDKRKDAVILGAGLAGLAAGWVLSKSGADILMMEKDSTVGGLARTIDHNGFRFDLGGHRFIANSERIERLVRQVLDDEVLEIRRSSKILLRNRYFDYPLKPLNAFLGLGFPTTLRIISEYAVERIKERFAKTEIVSLEDWVVRHFGRTMFNIFFKEYSEKVWGMDCDDISMEWVEQRIQGLSLGTVMKDALFGLHGRDVRTLASTYLYPALGIGQIADGLRAEIEKVNRVFTGTQIVAVNHSGDRIESVIARNGGRTHAYRANEFVSSIPLTAMVTMLRPPPPAAVLDAATRLRYRDIVITAVMIDRERVTDQNWIYVPEHKIRFGRIHEPTNWSAEMAPQGKTLLVTERFCFRGDDTWRSSDEELGKSTVASLVELGMIERREVIDNVVLRIANAYPIFEVGFRQHLETIHDYLERYRNLRLIGRAGMFRYFNMDHAMESGMGAADEILAAIREPDAGGEQPLPLAGTYQ